MSESYNPSLAFIDEMKKRDYHRDASPVDLAGPKYGIGRKREQESGVLFFEKGRGPHTIYIAVHPQEGDENPVAYVLALNGSAKTMAIEAPYERLPDEIDKVLACEGCK